MNLKESLKQISWDRFFGLLLSICIIGSLCISINNTIQGIIGFVTSMSILIVTIYLTGYLIGKGILRRDE